MIHQCLAWKADEIDVSDAADVSFDTSLRFLVTSLGRFVEKREASRLIWSGFVLQVIAFQQFAFQPGSLQQLLSNHLLSNDFASIICFPTRFAPTVSAPTRFR